MVSPAHKLLPAKIRRRKIQSEKKAYEFLVSACLAGIRCTYTGKSNTRTDVRRLFLRRKAVAVCPEVLGGLPIPRENSEIAGGSGEDVMDRKARVITLKGKDVSRHFLRGALETLRIAKKYKVRCAILKSKSPSCGFGLIYDGTFKRRLTAGNGVAAALLNNNGIRIWTR